MAQPAYYQQWWHPPIKKLIATRPMVWVLSRTFHHVDRFVLRISGGRYSAAAIMTGLPVVTLTTTGARSGKLRSVPLIGFPDEDKLSFIASNWGQSAHPSWYYNLRANPEAVISTNGQSKKFILHEATGSEWERCWQMAVDNHPGYAAYRQRASRRVIPIMVAVPVQNS